MISFLYNIIVGGCFHKWGKWVLIEKGTANDKDGIPLYFYRTYQRTCEKCDLGQLKQITDR